jgi:hypothetical protein
MVNQILLVSMELHVLILMAFINISTLIMLLIMPKQELVKNTNGMDHA